MRILSTTKYYEGDKVVENDQDYYLKCGGIQKTS